MHVAPPRFRDHRDGDAAAESLSTDVRFTLRTLRHAPWYSATVVGVVAVTLALATTVFAVVDGVLFRPLPSGRRPPRDHRAGFPDGASPRTDQWEGAGLLGERD